MNPFQRLRNTIEKVNINYQFQEDQAEGEGRSTANQQTYSRVPQKQSTVQNNEQIQRIKHICENQQLNNIKHLTQLTSKIELLQKNLRRSQSVIENQMNEIVTLQKQNEELKGNLNQQYGVVVQGDQKERKYKEEIYRINITINQLAAQIQSQRNAKKHLQKDLQTLRISLSRKQQEFQRSQSTAEKDKLHLKTELEERISMFEYNVKKAAEDRKEFKMTLSSIEENYRKNIQENRSQINRLQQQLFQMKKTIEIEAVHKKNLEENLQKQRNQLLEFKSINKKLEAELVELRDKYEKSIKSQEHLQKNVSQLGSQLAQQKKNMKVKVVEVRDQTLRLELQMYKRQCKDLLQERFIMKNLSPQEGCFQSEYKIVNSQESNSV